MMGKGRVFKKCSGRYAKPLVLKPERMLAKKRPSCFMVAAADN